MKISEHIETMEEPYRSLAKANFENSNNPDEEDVNKLSDALFLAFVWEDTEQGEEYWHNYYSDLWKNKKL